MSHFTDKALQLLKEKGAQLSSETVLVGLDGFVDQIIRVVDKRQKDGSATYVADMPTFAGRIQAAAGKSTKFDLSVQQVKLGGNGPIMAQALSNLGLSVTCVGNMGFPDLHPIFQCMKQTCRVLTVADASYTDALEFDDGKVMLSRQETAGDVKWDVLERVIGKEPLFRLFDEAGLIALNNWTALPHMSEIWRHLQKEVCPRFKKGRQRQIFFDLADPEFRLANDIREALDLIAGFQKFIAATLGLNQKEAGEICEVLGIHLDGVAGKDREFVQKSAEAIREKLGIEGVVVHATAFAAAASAHETALLDGPFVQKPLISTGAGDHFNAGYGLGTILGGDLEQRLQLGVASSGFYVHTAKSASIKELQGFLKEIGSY